MLKTYNNLVKQLFYLCYPGASKQLPWGGLESPLSRVYSSISVFFLSTRDEGVTVQAFCIQPCLFHLVGDAEYISEDAFLSFPALGHIIASNSFNSTVMGVLFVTQIEPSCLDWQGACWALLYLPFAVSHTPNYLYAWPFLGRCP